MEVDIANAINKYGFPIIAATGIGYMIYYVWTWATTEVKPVLSEANTVLIGLIDRIRMLDNDLIRLNQKLNIVLMLRGKEIESQRHLDDAVADVAAKEKEEEVQRTLKRTSKKIPSDG
jgi:hypothetical protein